jgi:uracil-DNA glycosylase
MKNEKINPKLHPEWLELLHLEFQKPYFRSLKGFLQDEKKKYTIYPPGKQIFSALDATPPGKTKVVIIGQDPYHGPNQANGMCFSVSKGMKLPPSLRNIFLELKDDLQIDFPQSGDLTPWARQGVLLLNATLTVRKAAAGSHQNKGWEEFTDAIIQALNQQFTGIVFLLWGNFAKRKVAQISDSKHHFLTAAHPSPFSAHNGFFGCKHFSKTNQLLQQMGKEPIDWRLDE